MLRFVLGVLVAAGLAGAASAQSGGAGALHDQVGGTIDGAHQTQQQLDTWAGDREALEVRYRTAQANIAYLQERVAREEDKARALDDAIAELDRRLDESARLKTVVGDTMAAVLGRLETAVARDLPFLPRERSERLAGLRRLLAEPTAGEAEKLRRLLEALIIEASYGESVEVAPQAVVLGNEEIHVDVLRVGRVAMFWRSPDGRRVGAWDPGAGAWTELPKGESRTIGRAMEMATRMRPVELIALPLGRIDAEVVR
ncbi:MAG TPA: DUF3450 domain-containing protein [Candidatus Krumholzibacteria bacterium]|nr:DUF3450 domain-containing protein [Candidatus Krumholzibacteria bacterium]